QERSHRRALETDGVSETISFSNGGGVSDGVGGARMKWAGETEWALGTVEEGGDSTRAEYTGGPARGGPRDPSARSVSPIWARKRSGLMHSTLGSVAKFRSFQSIAFG